MSSSDGAGGDRHRRGRLIVISGPSGAGKTSICKALLRQLPDAVWSVSVTTRPMRAGEERGDSYEYVSREEFARREAQGAFLETAEYIGHRYGTPRAPVEEALRAGRFVVLEIDVQGGMQVAKAVPDSIRVFVLPPDRDSLRARLEGRATEVAEQLAQRLAKADGEIAVARDSGCYPHIVVNVDLEETIEQVKKLVLREHDSV